jgi:hypothetical protein
MIPARPTRVPAFASLALLLALLLRAAIPAGYMLAPTDGLPQIIPCTGTGPAVHHHGGSHRSHDRTAETPCAFAMVAPPDLPGAPPLPTPPPAVGLLLATIAAETVPPRLRAILPPPATGPPAA